MTRICVNYSTVYSDTLVAKGLNKLRRINFKVKWWCHTLKYSSSIPEVGGVITRHKLIPRSILSNLYAWILSSLESKSDQFDASEIRPVWCIRNPASLVHPKSGQHGASEIRMDLQFSIWLISTSHALPRTSTQPYPQVNPKIHSLCCLYIVYSV